MIVNSGVPTFNTTAMLSPDIHFSEDLPHDARDLVQFGITGADTDRMGVGSEPKNIEKLESRARHRQT
jgi:hypothetical protein